MRIKLKAAVGIKTTRGGIDAGTVRWIDGDKMMLSSTGHLERGMTCELKLELNACLTVIFWNVRFCSPTCCSLFLIRFHD